MRKAGGERRPGRVRGCSSAGTRGWKERLSQVSVPRARTVCQCRNKMSEKGWRKETGRVARCSGLGCERKESWEVIEASTNQRYGGGTSRKDAQGVVPVLNSESRWKVHRFAKRRSTSGRLFIDDCGKSYWRSIIRL